jgi:hypothetical protein
MRSLSQLLLLSVTLVILTACSATVPLEKVYGDYIASYRYGTETISLNRDGTFVQRVEIDRESPASAGGSWEFDSKDSRVTLHGALIVDDGFGGLRGGWRTPTTGLVSFDVELHWFRVEMGTGLPNPYLKQ